MSKNNYSCLNLICFLSSLVFYSQTVTLDPSFNSSGRGISSDNVLSIDISHNGKIFIAGSFQGYNGVSTNRLARLNPDGSRDNSFQIGTGFNNFITKTFELPDLNILVAGYYTIYNGYYLFGFGRLTNTGSIDNSFNSDYTGGFDDFEIQNDGKIIVVGDFFSPVSGHIDVGRLNSDGTVDTSFIEGKSGGAVYSVKILSDGKILIGGSFSSYNNIPIKGIARLNSDGSLDSTFDPGLGVGSGAVYSISITNNNQIIIAGDFSSFNNTNLNSIARLNQDGSIDTSFDPGLGADNFIFFSLIQSDNKVIIGGSFTSFNNYNINNLARLNSDGSIDLSFDTGSGPNQGVFAANFQDDGKMLIGGQFTSFNNTNIRGIARLNGDFLSATDFDSYYNSNVVIYPNPTTRFVTFDNLPEESNIDIIGMGGAPVLKLNNIQEKLSVDLSAISSGTYIVRIKSKQGVDFKKLIIY